jgi:two-component system sensor histidine kinase DesK
MAPSRATEHPPKRELPLTEEGPRWQGFLWLAYLFFLVLPGFITGFGRGWLWPTLLSLPPFLLLYVWQFRLPRAPFAVPLGMALLGVALTPYNPFADVYVIFAASTVPTVLSGLTRQLLLVLAMLGVYALELVLVLPWHIENLIPLLVAVTVAPIVCAARHVGIENERKRRALRTSQEEVRRLAAVAERERIGRDLHDLLGHTLSLIALKSELAGRLLERDRTAAAREIAELESVARQALKEVRLAIAGMHGAVLDSELDAARRLLESSGVALVTRRDCPELHADTESGLAMIVREAITNIHRHAAAGHASVELRREAANVMLVIADDGRGGIVAQGRGLNGIEARVRALGGTLLIDSPPQHGTTLRVTLPPPAALDQPAVNAASGEVLGGLAPGTAHT